MSFSSHSQAFQLAACHGYSSCITEVPLYFGSTPRTTRIVIIKVVVTIY